MSVVGRCKGLSAWFTAVAVLFALVVPFAGSAFASHPTLDATPESQDRTAGQTATITVTGASASDEIDFEIDCISNCTGATYTVQGVTTGGAGGSTSAPDAPTDGDQTPQAADDTRTSPEMSCVTSGPGNTCSVTYTRNNSGIDYVATWHDAAPANNATDESDPTELPNETAPGGGGAQTENDSTDVVQVNWSQVVPANAKLDCDDDGAAGDFNDPNTSDNQNAPSGGAGVTYTCMVFNDNGAGGGSINNGNKDGGEAGISGIPIDVELAGANDPDNQGFGVAPPTNATADVNNACTTGADGTCTFTVTQTENETGATTVCAWADTDNDSEYNNNGAQADGEQCDNENVGDAEGDDLSDLMMVTWVTGGQGAAIDGEPEYQAVVKGGQVTVDVLVLDALGAPVANYPVDVSVTGRNAGLKCNNKLTGADGKTTCNYTDSNAAIPIGTTVTDTIDVCQSTTANPLTDCGTENVDSPERIDLLDTLQANFYNSQPTVDTLVADADANNLYPGGDPPNCNDGSPEATDTHGVNTVNVLCGDVTPGTGSPNPSPGQPITFTITSGPGYFFEDWDEGEDQDTGEPNVGSTITVNANGNGSAFALFNSQEAGTTTITVSSGGQTVTLTKTITGQPPRNIACTPDTAETQAGQPRTFTCVVTDRFGQPSFDALVGLIETGTAGSTGPNTCRNFDVLGFPTVPANYVQCSATNSQGQASFTVTSTPEEEGTQNLLFEIIRWNSPSGAPACPGADDCGDSENPGGTDPANDIGDPCDQGSGRLSTEEGGASDNSDATGLGPAPAGNCHDTAVNEIVQEDPACDDGADNDGDGFIDFPDDPGCDSDADDSEEPFNSPDPTKTNHPRNTNIKFDHSGRDRLTIFGDLDAPGFPECHKQEIIKVQRRTNGRWVTKKTTSTNGKGKWAVEINDMVSKFRAVAPKSKIVDSATNHTDVCNKTAATKKHNH